MRALAAAFLMLFLAADAGADTLVMRSGENKKGKVLAETDSQILFRQDPDGLVVEVPRSEVAIVETDASSGSIKKSPAGLDLRTPEKTTARKKPFDFLIAKDEKPASNPPITAEAALEKMKVLLKDHTELGRTIKQVEDGYAREAEATESYEKALKDQL